MKKLLALCVVLFLALGAVTLLGAQTPAPDVTGSPDVSGTWAGQISTPNGDMQLTFHFKQDGAKLTGTVDSPMGGDPMEVHNAKLDGNKIYWETSFNGMTIKHEGVVNGDEMKVTAKSDGDGGFPPMDLTLKRAKQ